jgi:glycosyltransferase involved in cell wall biosynthesis
MNQPLVTVITPTYNREDLLEETIQSVLAQGYPSLEYIVIDDGSQDNTKAILERYQDRLRCYHHENIGETRTVNRGFELARGEILCVLSSDDPMLAGTIQAGVDALTAHPEAVVAYPDWVRIDDTGVIFDEVRTADYSFRDMVLWHDCVPGPSTFFRRSLLDRVKGRDPAFRYTGDFDFWLRAGLEGPFVRIPHLFGCFREHRGSTTVVALSPEMAEEHIALMDSFFALQPPAEIEALRNDAYSSAYFAAGFVVGPDFRARFKYFSKALRTSSWSFLWTQRSRIPTMLILLFEGVPAVRTFRRILLDRQRTSAWRNRHYSLVAGDLT